ncbi:hypothetical protein TWF730_002081 [Orbilia blumenaviensis]|uniref:Integral membrane protein n=1 Tax=Orbilia blumenaviensis TaxID=1796055 RepID=A0AAV9UCW6_9PEZI
MGHESLCDSDGNLLVTMPFIALARNRPEVFLSSTVAVITSLVLPTTTALMWELQLPDIYQAKPQLNSTYIYVTAILVALVVLLAAGLIVRLTWKFKTGLYGDFDNLAGLAALICDSKGILDTFHGASFQSNKSINKLLKNQTFYLRHINVMDPITMKQEPRYQIIVDPVSAPISIGPPSPESEVLKPRNAHPFVLSWMFILLVDIVASIPLLVLRISVLLNKPIFFLDLLGIKGLLAFNYSVYTAGLTAMFNACLVMEPYSVLQRRNTWQSGSSLDTYTNASHLVKNLRAHSILVSIPLAIYTHCTISAITGLRLIFMVITSAVAPTCIEFLWKSPVGFITGSGENNDTKFLISLADGLDAWLLSLFCINCAGLLIVLILSKPIIPRNPNTIASRIAYLAHSERLLSDVRGYSLNTMRQLSERIMACCSDSELGGHTYGLGYIERKVAGHRSTDEKIYEVAIERGPLIFKYNFPSTHPAEQGEPIPPRRRTGTTDQNQTTGSGDDTAGASNNLASDTVVIQTPEPSAQVSWHQDRR